MFWIIAPQIEEKLNVYSYSLPHTMKRETKFMFLIIAPHNGETKCMFLIIAPHNEGRNYVLNHCTTQWREKLNECS